MTQATKSVLYKDFDLNLRTHPATGNLIIKKNNDAVKQGVRNVILTNKYERPYRPDFGSDIRKRLFELFGRATEMDVENDIENAFANEIKRAELIKTTVMANPDGNSLRVNIVYRPFNAKQSIETTLILERAR